jgi:malonyl-CoA/methylmalonyl-CoA synthetase
MGADPEDDPHRRRALAEALLDHGDRLAIEDPLGRWTYAELRASATEVAVTLLAGRDDLDGERVALLCRPGRDYVVALTGCWLAGGLAVPLHPDHPLPELRHVADDAEVATVLCSDVHLATADQLAATCGARTDTVPGRSTGDRSSPLPAVDQDRAALLVYTSGTTGRPKGATHTHRGITAQIAAMVQTWAWSPDDRVLLVLPLHHVHGIVNVTLCSLWCGAVCEAPGGFDAVDTWERLASGRVTVFMAVPTVYARLIAAWDAADEPTRRRWSSGAEQLRLMVSGSAALSVETLATWERLTGHRLLERYGMSELGMVLTNSLDRRVPGHVGGPFPGVEVRLVDDELHDVADGEQGELLVRGPQVFAGYWNRPEATDASFHDGWFRTGDVAVRSEQGYRLLGRASVDIIKSGGEKVSALEIEEVHRTHPSVQDCAVVGLPDDTWGQVVAIAVVAREGRGGSEDLTIDALRRWGKERLAPARVPARAVVVAELPRNAMGKVDKPAVARLFDDTTS